MEIYAQAANATEQVTSVQDLAGGQTQEGDGPAKIRLTYSTLQDINRARATFGLPAVCITQGSRIFASSLPATAAFQVSRSRSER